VASIAQSRPARSQFAARFSSHWPLKLVGITTFIAIFFLGYFGVLRWPLYKVTVMPLIGLDRAIPFQPLMLPVYFSLWFYVSIPPGLLLRRDELVAYGKIAGTQAIVGLAVFFFWPTTTPMTAGADWTRYPAFAWLKTVDASGNACPSLHVAFAIFSGVCLDRIFREMHSSWSLRALSVCWCLSIVYSTISTRQHVSVDVAGGAALGLLTALIGPRLIKTRIEE